MRDFALIVSCTLLAAGAAIAQAAEPACRARGFARSPSYLVVLRNAGHFAWVNCREAHTTGACLDRVANIRLATDYGIAFFDRYLKGLSPPLPDRQDPALAYFLSK